MSSPSLLEDHGRRPDGLLNASGRQRSPLRNRRSVRVASVAMLFLAAFLVGDLGVCAGQTPQPTPAQSPPVPTPSASPPVTLPTGAGGGPSTAPPATPLPHPPPSGPSPPPSWDYEANEQAQAQLQAQAASVADDAKLLAIGRQASAAQATAEGLLAARTNDLKSLDGQLSRYGVPGKKHALNERERRQKAVLLAKRGQVQTQLQQAQAVASAAGRTYQIVAERRRDSFTAKVLTHSDSPASPAFWTPLIEATGPDLRRLIWVAERAVAAAVQAPEPRGLLSFVISLVIAAGLMFPARVMLERLVKAGRSNQRQAGFRLTTHAIWIAVVDTVLPSLAANALHLGAQWGGLLSERADALASSGVIAISWGAAVIALGRATVAAGEQKNRLLEVPDDAISRVRFYLWLVALITGAGFLLTRLIDVIGASVPATIAANSVMSLAYAAVATLVLVSFGRNRRHLDEATPKTAAVQSSGWTLLSLVLTSAIVLTVAAVLAGYTTLAVLISGQIFWLSMLAAVTYMLLRFADDLSTVLFHPKGLAAQTLLVLFNLRSSTIRQIGILVAAGLQIFVVVGALSLALTPFGQSGATLLSHFDQLGGNFKLGSALISPKAVLAGLVSLAVGMAIVHIVKRWVVNRYLPATDWDAGVRNSVTTGVGYLGVGIALLCALGAMGLGFKQIALVASALSVGIGFGLQQVVQNFVSGVILLIERPVKVGDWVNLAGVEGDVKSIRVRATEIQTFDRTTVIVPNSDLITKVVQNKTLGDPRGRIQLQLSIANPADARRASELILAIANAEPAVLADPAPAVYIDSLASGGSVNFNCFLYVASPRDVYKTKSAIFYRVLDQFLVEKVAFMGAGGPQDVVIEAGPKMQTLLRSSTRNAVTPGAEGSDLEPQSGSQSLATRA